jgi:uncharacterized membrane protein YwzB
MKDLEKWKYGNEFDQIHIINQYLFFLIVAWCLSLTFEFLKFQDKTKREIIFPLMKQFKFNFQNSNFALNFTQISLKIPLLFDKKKYSTIIG